MMAAPASSAARTAWLYERLPEKAVRCLACNHKCVIKPDTCGECSVRMNRSGDLKLLVYGSFDAAHVDPRTRVMSVGTVGCNFSCRFCQNWTLSQQSKQVKHEVLEGKCSADAFIRAIDSLGEKYTPQQLVDVAVSNHCPSIAFTYNEPTIQSEFAYDTARLARQRGILSVYVTNGYMSDEMLATVGPWVDAMNIDLKSFKPSFYKNLSGARLDPVLRNIKKTFEAGIHVEVTTLVIPGENDSPAELRDIAEFLVNISPDIPWHVSAFHGAYLMDDRRRTPASTLVKAHEIGKEAGLRYVYTGNIASDDTSSTFCPMCKTRLIDRPGMCCVKKEEFNDGKCAKCGFKIYGVYTPGDFRTMPTTDAEAGFPRNADA